MAGDLKVVPFRRQPEEREPNAIEVIRQLVANDGPKITEVLVLYRVGPGTLKAISTTMTPGDMVLMLEQSKQALVMRTIDEGKSAS